MLDTEDIFTKISKWFFVSQFLWLSTISESALAKAYLEDKVWKDITSQKVTHSTFQEKSLSLLKKFPTNPALLLKLSEQAKFYQTNWLQKAFLERAFFLNPFLALSIKDFKHLNWKVKVPSIWFFDISFFLLFLSLLIFIFYFKKRYKVYFYSFFLLSFCVMFYCFQDSLKSQALVIDEQAKVFISPNEESSLLIELPRKENIKLLNFKKDWTQIETVDKKIGWIKTQSFFITSGWSL